MKIIGLEADGFRGLKAVEMEFAPQGLIPIYGKNRQGKTSILDFILWMIYGNKELNPDIIGKDKDRIKGILKLDKYEIVREFPRKGTPKLKVKNTETGKYEEGEVQNFLNAFINKLTIDTRPFLDETALGKLKYLLDLLGIDFTEINNTIKTLEQDRLIVGREFDKFGDLDEDAPARVERVNTDKLFAERKKIEERNRNNSEQYSLAKQAEIEEIEKFNKEQREKQKNIESSQKLITENLSDISKTKETIADLKRQLSQAESWLTTLQNTEKELNEVHSKLPKPEPEKPLKTSLPDWEPESTEAIDKQIQDANAVNVKADIYEKWVEKKTEKEKKGKEYENYDRQIKDQRELKLEILRKAKHGVKGLEIREDGLYYNDTFSENWSDAESIRIISELALSRLDREKQIEALFLDRFESFDKDMRADLEKMCEDVGIQVVVTIVRNSTKEIDEDGAYFFIKDGSVELVENAE